MDHDGEWPFHTLDSDGHKELLTKLGQMEGSSIDEQSGKQGAKLIPAENMCTKAQKRLRDPA